MPLPPSSPGDGCEEDGKAQAEAGCGITAVPWLAWVIAEHLSHCDGWHCIKESTVGSMQRNTGGINHLPALYQPFPSPKKGTAEQLF